MGISLDTNAVDHITSQFLSSAWNETATTLDSRLSSLSLDITGYYLRPDFYAVYQDGKLTDYSFKIIAYPSEPVSIPNTCLFKVSMGEVIPAPAFNDFYHSAKDKTDAMAHYTVAILVRAYLEDLLAILPLSVTGISYILFDGHVNIRIMGMADGKMTYQNVVVSKNDGYLVPSHSLPVFDVRNFE